MFLLSLWSLYNLHWSYDEFFHLQKLQSSWWYYTPVPVSYTPNEWTKIEDMGHYRLVYPHSRGLYRPPVATAWVAGPLYRWCKTCWTLWSVLGFQTAAVKHFLSSESTYSVWTHTHKHVHTQLSVHQAYRQLISPHSPVCPSLQLRWMRGNKQGATTVNISACFLCQKCIPVWIWWW